MVSSTFDYNTTFQGKLQDVLLQLTWHTQHWVAKSVENLEKEFMIIFTAWDWIEEEPFNVEQPQVSSDFGYNATFQGKVCNLPHVELSDTVKNWEKEFTIIFKVWYWIEELCKVEQPQEKHTKQ